MKSERQTIKIPCVSNDGRGASVFTSRNIELHGNTERFLSEQQAAENFRLRTSDSTYASSWHVAGDPTLLVILTGTIRIELRNGERQKFAKGEMFIAEDYLLADVEFDDASHGHRAEVIGAEVLSVLHLKLEKRS